MAQYRSSLNVRTYRMRSARRRESVLRKQLALCVERQGRPRRADDAIRLALVGLSRLIEWRHLLIVVKPETLIRWHRKGFGCSGGGGRGHPVDRACQRICSG